MAVYIDPIREVEPTRNYPYKSTCHMIADTSEELLAFAEKIGLNQKWIQHRGDAGEHFDMTAKFREKAKAAGAKEITTRQLVSIVQQKRNKPKTELAQKIRKYNQIGESR